MDHQDAHQCQPYGNFDPLTMFHDNNVRMSPNAQRFLSKAALTLGSLLFGVALLANYIGLSQGSVGKPRLVVGIAGGVLLLAGLLGKRLFLTYKAIVFTIANTVLLCFVLEGAATFANRHLTQTRPDQAHAELREVAQTSVARSLYVGFRGQPYAGQIITIGEDGNRITPNSQSDGSKPEPLRIFAFGGSTMWGEGASNDQTIPAYLQQMLREETGARIDITNFGQRAWVSTQSLIQLMLELKKGNVPDVVLFYDGYNDTTATCLAEEVGVPENFEGLTASVFGTAWLRKKFGRTEIGRLVDRMRPKPQKDPIDAQQVADEVVQNYLAVFQLVKAMGAHYGFAVEFYWQPQLFGDQKPLTAEEQQLLDHPWLSPNAKTLLPLTYARARKLTEQYEDITDVSDAFSNMPERLYLDPCHVVGIGNQRVAEVMVERGLLETIKRELSQQNRVE